MGIYQISADKVRGRLFELKEREAEFAAIKVPSKATMLKCLREQFHLRYGKDSGANPRYRDPTYNEKLLWVSRLLAQFFLEDALVISVDESNFRSDTLPQRSWTFNQGDMFKKAKAPQEGEHTANSLLSLLAARAEGTPFFDKGSVQAQSEHPDQHLRSA